MERPPYPTERDLADAREEQFELRHHVAYPGRVQAYYPETQTADVVPLIRQQVPQPDGSYVMEELPVVPSVPVIFPRVGAWFLSFPIAPNDTVQLLVNTSAIGHWRVGSGDVTDPGDLRRQHLSHAVAIPGLYTRGRALRQTGAAGVSSPPQSLPTGVVLGSDETDGPRLLIKADGSIEVVTGGVTVASVAPDGTVSLGGPVADARAAAVAALVDQNLTAIRDAFDAWTPVPNDGGAALKTAMTSWTRYPTAASKVRVT